MNYIVTINNNYIDKKYYYTQIVNFLLTKNLYFEKNS